MSPAADKGVREAPGGMPGRDRPVLVGAVLYDPKVSVIWDAMCDYFMEMDCPMDVVYYTNYGLQVKALVQGHIDIAWNSPLAWVDTRRQLDGQCRAIAMRDTDRDRRSYIVAQKQGPVQRLEDLRGRTLAVGAKDSPQATLIPLAFIDRAGLRPGLDFQVRRFDVLVGKHGDHIGGEWDALRCLQRGEADACAMMDLNWEAWVQEGTIDSERFFIVAETEPYDHCVFTVRADMPQEAERRWLDVLFSMRYDDPNHRKIMDMEGLRAWLPGRTTGFQALEDAVDRFGFFEGKGP